MNHTLTPKKFERFQQGDQDILWEIMSNYSALVYHRIRMITKSDADSEELTQDVFLKLWKNRRVLISPSGIPGYLLRIARNDALNFIYKAGLQTVELGENDQLIEELAPDVESEYERKELALLISITVARMPKQRSRVFQMSRYEGLDHQEIALELEISPTTVSRHLAEALKELKKILPSTILLLVSLILALFYGHTEIFM